MKAKFVVIVSMALLAAAAGRLSAQSQAPMADTLLNVEKMMAALKVNALVGEPIRAGDSIIIPFSRIKFGVGAGGSAMAFGGGLGGKVIPAGFLIIEGDQVKIELLPLEEKKPSFFQEMLPTLLKMLPQIMGGKHSSAAGTAAGTQGPAAEKARQSATVTTGAQLEQLYKEGKLEEALAAVDSLLEKDPDCAELHAWKGAIMGSLVKGDNPLEMMKYGMGAMQEFETAVKLDPANIRARFGRGMGRMKAPEGFGRDYAGAIEDFSFVCQKEPSHEAYYQLGLAHQGNGDLDQAKEALKKALAMKPGDPETAKALAAIK
ncbi:MAG: spore germination protein GerW family protein [Acidobacteriota bacterium]|nr:spore germination protein GerW family protein [Acidobacteriota bacterium]